MDQCVNAEAVAAQAQEQHAQLSVAHTALLGRVSELQAALRGLEQENVRIQEATQAAVSAAHARFDKLSAEHRALHSAHMECNRKVSTRRRQTAYAPHVVYCSSETVRARM